MKKQIKRICSRVLAFVLSTVMILGMVSQFDTMPVKAASDGPKITQWNLTVSEGAIGLNLYFSGISDEDAGKMTVKVDGTSHQFGAKLEDGSYGISHRVQIKDVFKKLSVTLYKGSTKVDLANASAVSGSVSCSVGGYLDQIKDLEDENGILGRSLLNYATCANNYANGTTTPVSLEIADLTAYAPKTGGNLPDCITFEGSELVLTDTFAIRHYFKFSEVVTDGEMYVDGKEATYHLTDKPGQICVEISDIRAWDIDHAFVFEGTAKNEKFTLTYSVLSYAYLALKNGGDDKLSQLVTSIYWYKVGFNECLEMIQGGGHGEDPGENPGEDPGENPGEDPGENPGENPGEITTDFVTYKMFGAKGDGKTNDYAAIVATHEYANANNKAVKADEGAVYYIDKMDPKNPKGAIIKTNTYWGNAQFIIDDSKMKLKSVTFDSKGKKSVTYPDDWDGLCYLFTIEPSVQYQETYLNYNLWWGKENGKWVYHKEAQKQEGDQKIYLGVDSSAGSFSMPDIQADAQKIQKAVDMQNHSFTKDTTKLVDAFDRKALYTLKTNAFKRYGRLAFGNNEAASSMRAQEEVIVVDANGTIDPLSKLQFDWKEIITIQKTYIDDTLLTVQGGIFTTKVNTVLDDAYMNRGIKVCRSNVLLKGIRHYLDGEDAQYDDTSIGHSGIYNRDDAFARYGAPYQGFFQLNRCAYVTIQDCVFSAHHRVFSSKDATTKEWSNESSTAPYDFYAEYCVGLTLDNCKSAKSIIYSIDYVNGLLGNGPKVAPTYDEEGILDDLRWGVSGTNYCKSITVQNGCALNRIDAHKGTYNLTVKDSTMGWLGILAVGYGTMHIENIKSYASSFITLRRDYGSAWYGDIEIKNCTWDIGTNYRPRLIFAQYMYNNQYGYDTIDSGTKYSDGKPFLYYSQLPTNVTISGLTIDASDVTNSTLYDEGIGIFSNIFGNPGSYTIDDKFLTSTPYRTVYNYPLLAPKKISLSGLKLIMNPVFVPTDGTSLKAPDVYKAATTKDHQEYFFDKTIFDYDPSKTEVKAATGN